MLKGLDISKPPRGLPPVHMWDPPFCGDMDLIIKRDGTWVHEGSPIGRPEMVKLFASVLRLDPEGYMLVTPVEKLRIQVEDTPFRAIAADWRGDTLVFTTDVGDLVPLGVDHALAIAVDQKTKEPNPTVHVRSGLMARVVRSVFYDLVNMSVPRGGQLVIQSAGQSFSLGEEPEI